jgi:hypothetical protein
LLHATACAGLNARCLSPPQSLRKRRLDAELDAAFDDVYDEDDTPPCFDDDDADDTPAPAEEVPEPDALCA